MKIPANAKEHAVVTSVTFKQDSLIYSLHPHSHFRGRAASFVAYYPDGHEETLLNGMKGKGAKINRPPVEPFRKAVQSVYAKAREKYGADVDAALADAEATRKGLQK